MNQNFARAFDIKFLGRDQKTQFACTTSWGVSTRLIGAMIMTHSDDEGLVVPPAVAPTVLAIMPIFKNPEERKLVGDFATKVLASLVGEQEMAAAAKRHSSDDVRGYFFDRYTSQRIVLDDRDIRPGEKQYHWEQRGVPLRMEIGPRDVAAGSVLVKKRLDREKFTVPLAEISAAWLQEKLSQIQTAMLEKARAFRDNNTRDAASYDDLKKIIETNGGLVRAWFKPDRANEAKIKEQTKATVRCIVQDDPAQSGKCIYTGETVHTQVLFAQAY
jgi:prolyl-tRNA synthetase